MLEGIGLICKERKNNIRWNGPDAIHRTKRPRLTATAVPLDPAKISNEASGDASRSENKNSSTIGAAVVEPL